MLLERRLGPGPILVALSVVLLLPVLARAGTTNDPARTLTFEERVRAQEAIERVYYSHQIGAARPFEQAVPRAALESKVRDSLLRSAALEKYWHTPVTTAALQAELERMARGTRTPERLIEIYRALGNDPTIIRETFARQSLVDRLSRSFFDFDKTIHAAARDEAQGIEGLLRSGRLNPRSQDPHRSVMEIHRSESPAAASPPSRAPRPAATAPGAAYDSAAIDLDPDAYGRVRSRAPGEIGEIGAIVERPDAFTLSVVLDEKRDRVRIATYVVPKSSWETWWADARRGLEEVRSAVPDEAMSAAPVPLPHTATACTGDDTWDNGVLDDYPDALYGYAAAVWTGTMMVVLGSSGNSSQGGRYDPVTDTWSGVSFVGAPQILAGQSTVWTGSKVVVWGGRWSTYLNTGGAYDPATDTWSALSTLNAPSGRQYHTAVWTGQVMVVWGGYNGASEVNTGGRYDPTTDSWQSTAMLFAPDPRQHHTAVWGAGQMLVWGGSAGSTNLASGARYSPTTNTWSPISVGGPPPDPALNKATAGGTAPAPRAGHVAVWTGTEMIIWGGSGGGSQLPGARYNPQSDSWTPMATDFQPPSVADKSAVWTGSRMLVWGGISGAQNPGGQYNPSTDSWQRTSYANTPTPKASMPAVWTGTRMIVWSGGVEPAGRYDPGSDSWTPASLGVSSLRRDSHAAVWTGNVMVIWGGNHDDSGTFTPLNTGGRYDPATDSWSPTSTVGAPLATAFPQAVWTGSLMVTWGQPAAGDPLGAKRYDPILDTWQPVSAPPAPGPGLLLGWSGSRVVFVGAAYDPVGDTWSPHSTSGMPTNCSYCTSVWTGSGAILWGGAYNGFQYIATGGRYDLASDTWSPMSQGPAGRRNHTAVWTGTRMFVWGGYNGSDLNDGGLYDPVNDRWEAVSTVNAPLTYSYGTSIWTGNEVVVWGGTGRGGGFPDRVGGRYDPAHNTWRPTASINAPSARIYHSAVWTGSSMVIWGGGPGFGSGGRYAIAPAIDQDGDGYSACGGDCNDADPRVYPGAAEICDGLDNNCNGLSDENFGDPDGDGWGNACDCAPNDGTAFALPGEVSHVGCPSNSSVQWDPMALSSGSGTVYDVIRSPLVIGTVPPGPSSVCLASGVPDAMVSDLENPPRGVAFWYLIRARDACGAGTYGSASSGSERVSHVCAP